ncbi:MAG: trimethylamine methyltransferase family protein, partial [Lentisphaeria bacterium]|nr:trimethylamine methyltransferase family protein [Lentisphaeria bacterium]
RLESLETALVLAEYAQRPAPPFAWYADQIDYLREMGDILGIPNWFTYGATCFAHPLRFDRDVADKFVRRIREGGPAGLTAMPVAGMTTPVTVEGFIAVAAAEHVATWMAGRALDPACPLGGSMWSGTVDMRTGSVSYSTFDALFYGFACCEFLRLWTGRHLPVGGGEYCDAREPGTFAAMEKAWKAMTIAAFQGSHPSIGQGMLECGRTLCPVQVLLEQDFFHGLEQMAQTVQPTPDRIDLDGIADVDLGLTRSYLAGAGTLAHFRELWLPRFVPRSGWDGPRGDRLALDRARGRMDELLDAYRKPEGREDVLERLRAVVARARQRLL